MNIVRRFFNRSRFAQKTTMIDRFGGIDVVKDICEFCSLDTYRNLIHTSSPFNKIAMSSDMSKSAIERYSVRYNIVTVYGEIYDVVQLSITKKKEKYVLRRHGHLYVVILRDDDLIGVMTYYSTGQIRSMRQWSSRSFNIGEIVTREMSQSSWRLCHELNISAKKTRVSGWYSNGIKAFDYSSTRDSNYSYYDNGTARIEDVRSEKRRIIRRKDGTISKILYKDCTVELRRDKTVKRLIIDSIIPISIDIQ